MENNIITINFFKNKSYELTDNNPDINGLMKFALDIKDQFKIEDISVECEKHEFDKEGFEEILKESFNKFFDKLEVNSNELQTVLKDLKVNQA